MKIAIGNFNNYTFIAVRMFFLSRSLKSILKILEPFIILISQRFVFLIFRKWPPTKKT